MNKNMKIIMNLILVLTIIFIAISALLIVVTYNQHIEILKIKEYMSVQSDLNSAISEFVSQQVDYNSKVADTFGLIIE